MSLFRKKKWWAALLVSGALVFQNLPSGCAEYYTNMGLTGFNFCSVFNCSGGTYFNFCSPVPMLIDCPQPIDQSGS